MRKYWTPPDGNLEADDNREKSGIIHSFVWMSEKMLKTVEQKELRAGQWRLEEDQGGELRFPHMWHSNASLVHDSNINWEALMITVQINIMIYSNTNIILMWTQAVLHSLTFSYKLHILSLFHQTRELWEVTWKDRSRWKRKTHRVAVSPCVPAEPSSADGERKQSLNTHTHKLKFETWTQTGFLQSLCF